MTADKCRISDDGMHVYPCDLLYNQTHGQYAPNRKARGIFMWALSDWRTRQATRTFFGVVSTASPNGWIFNFCPFCGTRIDSPVVNSDSEITP